HLLIKCVLGNQFSGEFESHIRRVIRLLWHCCGHLASKHWDELGELHCFSSYVEGQLELRPQCALVMAHLSKLSKTFALLDSKDQQLINNMVQTVRIWLGSDRRLAKPAAADPSIKCDFVWPRRRWKQRSHATMESCAVVQKRELGRSSHTRCTYV
ncbi:unnamed protein product, partial [Cylicostephanus goldi]